MSSLNCWDTVLKSAQIFETNCQIPRIYWSFRKFLFETFETTNSARSLPTFYQVKNFYEYKTINKSNDFDTKSTDDMSIRVYIHVLYPQN